MVLRREVLVLMKRENPVELVEKTVHGMLPYTILGDKMRNTFMLMKKVNILMQLKNQWSLNKEIKKCQERKQTKLIRALAEVNHQ